MLLKFLNVFFKVLTSNSSLLKVKGVSSGMPRSLFTIHKYLGTDEDKFVYSMLCVHHAIQYTYSRTVSMLMNLGNMFLFSVLLNTFQIILLKVDDYHAMLLC